MFSALFGLGMSLYVTFRFNCGNEIPLLLLTTTLNCVIAGVHVYVGINALLKIEEKRNAIFYTRFLTFVMPALNFVERLFDNSAGGGRSSLMMEAVLSSTLLAVAIRVKFGNSSSGEIGSMATMVAYSSAIFLIFKEYGVLGGVGRRQLSPVLVCVSGLLVLGVEPGRRMKTLDQFGVVYNNNGSRRPGLQKKNEINKVMPGSPNRIQAKINESDCGSGERERVIFSTHDRLAPILFATCLVLGLTVVYVIFVRGCWLLDAFGVNNGVMLTKDDVFKSVYGGGGWCR